MIWIWACAVPAGGEDSAVAELPASPTVSISPEAPLGGEALTAEATGEGTLAFSWYRDNALQEELVGAFVPASTTERDEVWRVVVESELSGSDPASTEVTIGNSPPAILSVSLPDGITTELSVAASAETEDADGDPVTLSWTWWVDGVEVAGVTGSTLGAGAARRDQLVEVSAVPDDGDLEGEAAGASITVGNAAPSLAVASLAGTTAEVGSTLEVLTEGWSDPDGDEEGYLYAWYLDGALSDHDGASLLLDLEVGAIVQAEVTPYDGIDEGAPVLTDAVLVVEAS